MNGDSVQGPKHGQGEAGQTRDYLNVRECARIVGLSGESIRRAIHRRDLAAFLLGHALRVRKTDLERWIQAQRWSEALCAQRTARPRAGHRKRKGVTAVTESPGATPGAAVAQ